MREPKHGLIAAGVVLFTLVGALLWISMITGPVRLLSGLLDARADLQRAERLISRGAFKEANLRTLSAGASLARARDGLSAGGPILSLARVVPAVDDALTEVPHLLEAAEHSVGALRGTLDVALNALRGPNQIVAEDPRGEGSVIRIDRVRELGDTISTVRNELRAAADALEKLNVKHLPRRLRPDIEDALSRARESDELLADAERGLAILPAFLGADGKRTYLLAMQNSAELRGTGGAILQFRLLEFDEGKPALVTTERGTAGSVYNVDRNRQRLDITLPEDAWYVNAIRDAQRFGNANWSPDWPLSAKLTVDYGRAAAENFPDVDFPDIDGVIGVDPVAMQQLMPGAGRYRTEKSGNRITAQRVVPFLLNRAYGSFPRPLFRRAVLRQVVNGFYQRLFAPARPSELVRGFGDALRTKHMQIWLADPLEEEFIRRMNWDGRVKPNKRGDYLAVVQQNVGGNKLDYFASMTNDVSIEIDGADALVSTDIEIRNGIFLPQSSWAMGNSGPLHRAMINVYVPQNAELVNAGAPASCPSPDYHSAACRRDDSPPGLVQWIGNDPPTHFEQGKKVWSTTLQIPVQRTGAVRFDYRVPGVLRTKDGRRLYRLVLQKQPKIRAEQTTVRLDLPDGARAVHAPGWERDGDVLMWDRPLTEDVVLEVSWAS
ncbi:MAG: DUF4012 domain-containing protein [Actinomycetota bacterium]